MKKSIILCFLLVYTSVNLFAQQAKKSEPYVQNLGAYIVTIDNGKIISMIRNPNFDTSKALRRDTTTSRIPHGITEIYYPGNNRPTVKRYFIYNLASISSERGMSRQERKAKYQSQEGVSLVYLKPGITTLNAAELLSKFGVTKKDINLPLYENFRPIDNSNDFLAVPDAVLKVNVIRDKDGFRFVNIITKDWDEENKKNDGKTIIRIK